MSPPNWEGKKFFSKNVKVIYDSQIETKAVNDKNPEREVSLRACNGWRCHKVGEIGGRPLQAGLQKENRREIFQEGIA